METNREKSVQDEVDKTMNVLNSLEHPTASSDFYARLSENLKLEEDEKDDKVKPLYTVRRLLYVAAAVALLLVNTVTMYKVLGTDGTTSSRDGQIENLIDIYGLEVSDSYNV